MKPRRPSDRTGAGRGGAVRAAAYLRVSTGDQHASNQLDDILRVARARGFDLGRASAHYVETVSANARTRPEFEQMREDARAGRFQVLMVWALDRFGRSMHENLLALLELDRLGVEVVSVREPWLDTGGPARELLIAIVSWVAEQERVRLGERTKAGLERARARGTRLGRPRRLLTTAELERARALWKAGVPIRKLAQQMRVPRATLHRLVSETPSSSGGEKGRLPRGARRASKKRTIGGR